MPIVQTSSSIAPGGIDALTLLTLAQDPKGYAAKLNELQAAKDAAVAAQLAAEESFRDVAAADEIRELLSDTRLANSRAQQALSDAQTQAAALIADAKAQSADLIATAKAEAASIVAAATKQKGESDAALATALSTQQAAEILKEGANAAIVAAQKRAADLDVAIKAAQAREAAVDQYLADTEALKDRFRAESQALLVKYSKR